MKQFDKAEFSTNREPVQSNYDIALARQLICAQAQRKQRIEGRDVPKVPEPVALVHAMFCFD